MKIERSTLELTIGGQTVKDFRCLLSLSPRLLPYVSQWLAAKRAASSDEGELVGRTDEPDLEPGVGSEDACQTEASGQAREGTPPGDVGDKVKKSSSIHSSNQVYSVRQAGAFVQATL